MINLNGKIYMIVTIWDFPFGGGEEFMFGTTEWAHSVGMKNYWINFCSAKNKNHTEFEIVEHQTVTIIRVPGGYDNIALTDWIRLIRPDIVHHQGSNRMKIYMACKDTRTRFISGFHFWTGGIILNQEKKNVDILLNAKYHTVDPELEYLVKEQECDLYCASVFVKNCIQRIANINIEKIIIPASSCARYGIPNICVKKNKYVSAINIHKLKGGDLLLYLIENCPTIPFLFVKTEFFSEELDARIESAIDKRNQNDMHEKCILMERTDNPIIIYEQTRIMLVPSLADETFCRVVNESMMNGIPTLTSGQGNIRYLIGNSAPIIDKSNFVEWKRIIEEYYSDDTKIDECIVRTLKQYQLNSEEIAKKQFISCISDSIVKSKEYNVMIFTVWCDQGLGIQSRQYYNILKSMYRIYIFSVKPYNANTCIELQKNPEEWATESVYYSSNDREHVHDDEIYNFVKKYNIGKCLIPETCWERIFQITRLLNDLNVKVYAIPNIEIVRKDEIFKHNYFYKILCNNYLCKNIFEQYSVMRTEYIGYGIPWNGGEKKLCKKDGIDFLFIGGMNAFSRKNLLLICEAFADACTKASTIKLTATIQKLNGLETDVMEKMSQFLQHPKISIISQHLSYADILKLYEVSDISIQVSKHEGLGIGFYEALSYGVPIITLATPPHNEIVIDRVNGWIIPPQYIPMTDNTSPIFDSAIFDPHVLSDKIVELANNPDDVLNVKMSIENDFINRLSDRVFENKLKCSL